MTEDEAKTKWCPFVRVSGTGGEWHTNRPSHADVDAKPFDHCIGSACMAWRVDAERFQDARSGRLSDRDTTGHGTWIKLGHCGLAGEKST